MCQYSVFICNVPSLRQYLVETDPVATVPKIKYTNDIHTQIKLGEWLTHNYFCHKVIIVFFMF